jgi:toxin ParE1/3/4
VKEIAFFLSAEQELQQSRSFYEAQSPETAERFSREIEELIKNIQAFPEAGATVDGRTRRRMCKRFPFAIIYRVAAEKIYIVAVMHQHRRPDYWKGRRS